MFTSLKNRMRTSSQSKKTSCSCHFTKVRNSSKLLDDLRTICSVKQKQFIMPVQDVETRWNATYYMIECQIKIRKIMEILVHSHSDILENLFPTVLEWGKIVVSMFYLYYII